MTTFLDPLEWMVKSNPNNNHIQKGNNDQTTAQVKTTSIQKGDSYALYEHNDDNTTPINNDVYHQANEDYNSASESSLAESQTTVALDNNDTSSSSDKEQIQDETTHTQVSFNDLPDLNNNLYIDLSNAGTSHEQKGTQMITRSTLR